MEEMVERNEQMNQKLEQRVVEIIEVDEQEVEMMEVDKEGKNKA